MKKVVSLSLVVMMIATIFVGCGNKTKVTIKMDIKGDVKTVEYKTDKETLEDLLVEKTDELKATLKDSEYGKYVVAINGYTPDATKNEYIEVLVDGKSSQVGVKEIKIEDGKVYTFKVSTFTK